MKLKEFVSPVVEELKKDEQLSKFFDATDYFNADFHFAESELCNLDEVEIGYSGSEGIYADFNGFLSECEDRVHVFTLKTLDDSAAAFRQMCDLSGFIVEVISDLLDKEKEEKKKIQSIKEDIENALDDIFLKAQDACGIEDGGIEPLDSLNLENAVESLALQIFLLVNKQKEVVNEQSDYIVS